MNVIKHRYGKRTVSLLLAVILVLCPLRVRAADNKPTIGIGDYIKSAQDPMLFPHRMRRITALAYPALCEMM